MFQLEKWYCDVTSEDGAAAICYAARLRWGPVLASYAATLVAGDHAQPLERATTRGVELPRLAADAATWTNGRLDTEGRWCRGAPAIAQRLAAGPNGAIDWTCHMPRARVSVRIGATQLSGWGYVEQLRLTIPPWQLPFTSLRWGRYLSDRHWLVWIDWSGGDARRWTWLDGIDQPGARAGAGGVDGLGDGHRLVFDETHALRDQPLLAAVRRPLPALARRLARALGRAQECKRAGSASLVNGAGARDRGAVVYEEVSW